MANPYSGIEKSVDGVSKAVSELRRSEGRVAVDVDLLTSSEVEELRLLIEHEDDMESFANSRIGELGQMAEGMYAEFQRLGLIHRSNGVPIVITPMAHWAVEKHSQRAAERERKELARRRFERNITILAGVIGLVASIVGAVIGSVVTNLLAQL